MLDDSDPVGIFGERSKSLFSNFSTATPSVNMKLFDRFLLWMSGQRSLVLVEDINLIVILDRSGERYEWPGDRVSSTMIRCKIADLRRTIGPSKSGVNSSIDVFPEDAINLVVAELSKKGMTVEIEK